MKDKTLEEIEMEYERNHLVRKRLVEIDYAKVEERLMAKRLEAISDGTACITALQLTPEQREEEAEVRRIMDLEAAAEDEV